MQPDHYMIGRVPIAITSTADATRRIKEAIARRRKGYVCISNMRTVTVANTTPDYLAVMRGSLFNTPDGTPLVWCARAWGLKEAQRACGPHVFRALLQEREAGLRHFFLGDTEATLDALARHCRSSYGTDVAGLLSPPFLPLEEYDLEGMAARINASGANLVWTSLRAPKQDYLAARLLPLLDDGIVVVGVGAAFRFELGEYRSSDGMMQRLGLGGLRIRREGTRFGTELRWYLKHSLFLAAYLLGIVGKRLVGKKYYE